MKGLTRPTTLEFTTIECYTAYQVYTDVMDLIEGMLKKVAERVLNKTSLEYHGHTIELGQPWARRHMVDLIKEVTGVDFWQAMDFDQSQSFG